MKEFTIQVFQLILVGTPIVFVVIALCTWGARRNPRFRDFLCWLGAYPQWQHSNPKVRLAWAKQAGWSDSWKTPEFPNVWRALAHIAANDDDADVASAAVQQLIQYDHVVKHGMLDFVCSRTLHESVKNAIATHDAKWLQTKKEREDRENAEEWRKSAPQRRLRTGLNCLRALALPEAHRLDEVQGSLSSFTFLETNIEEIPEALLVQLALRTSYTYRYCKEEQDGASGTSIREDDIDVNMDRFNSAAKSELQRRGVWRRYSEGVFQGRIHKPLIIEQRSNLL